MAGNPCRCEQCSDDPALTWTEAHRLECEARFVMRMRRAERWRYLDKVERRRGLDAVIVIKHAMAKLPTPHGNAER